MKVRHAFFLQILQMESIFVQNLHQSSRHLNKYAYRAKKLTLQALFAFKDSMIHTFLQFT